MNHFNQAVILSGELSNLSAVENEKRTSNLQACLVDCGFSFKTCIGVYKGSKEVSFVVLVKNSGDIQALKDFAFKSFKQESLMFQDANGLCNLEFSNGTNETLGKFRTVNPKFIEQYDNYMVLDGKVFVTKEL